MVQRVDTINVSFEQWQDHVGDIYTVHVGPATCEISRRGRLLRLSVFGRKYDIPLVGGTTLTYRAEWGSLQATDSHNESWTEFKLVWDDKYREEGCVATSYIPTTSATNLVQYNDDFSHDAWKVDTRYRTLDEQWGKVREEMTLANNRYQPGPSSLHWERASTQEQLNKLTSPAAERNRKLLLCL
jgi:hypothetical protein